MPAPINTFPSRADLLEQLKAQLPELLFATVRGTFATYERQLDTTSKQLDITSSELQNARLKI